jgi:hypothetical protein
LFFFTKCTARRHFSCSSLAQELFWCTVLPLGNSFFRVCYCFESPGPFFLVIFFFCDSLLSRSPVPKPATSLIGGFAFCVLFGPAHKDSLLRPDSLAAYFLRFSSERARPASPCSVSLVVSGFASPVLAARIFLLPRVDQFCLTRTVFPFIFSVKVSAASAVPHSGRPPPFLDYGLHYSFDFSFEFLCVDCYREKVV